MSEAAGASANPGSRALDLDLVTPDGRRLVVGVSMAPLRLENGVGVILIMRDVTARIETQRLLEGARERIRAALDWNGEVIFTSGASEAIALALGQAQAGEATPRAQREGVVLEQEVVPRRGPAAIYEPAFETLLHAGAEFRVTRQSNDWWEIALPGAAELCWIPAGAARIIAP